MEPRLKPLLSLSNWKQMGGKEADEGRKSAAQLGQKSETRFLFLE